jgi:hypothetical protein
MGVLGVNLVEVVGVVEKNECVRRTIDWVEKWMCKMRWNEKNREEGRVVVSTVVLHRCSQSVSLVSQPGPKVLEQLGGVERGAPTKPKEGAVRPSTVNRLPSPFAGQFARAKLSQPKFLLLSSIQSLLTRPLDQCEHGR